MKIPCKVDKKKQFNTSFLCNFFLCLIFVPEYLGTRFDRPACVLLSVCLTAAKSLLANWKQNIQFRLFKLAAPSANSATRKDTLYEIPLPIRFKFLMYELFFCKHGGCQICNYSCPSFIPVWNLVFPWRGEITMQWLRLALAKVPNSDWG